MKTGVLHAHTILDFIHGLLENFNWQQGRKKSAFNKVIDPRNQLTENCFKFLRIFYLFGYKPIHGNNRFLKGFK